MCGHVVDAHLRTFTFPLQFKNTLDKLHIYSVTLRFAIVWHLMCVLRVFSTASQHHTSLQYILLRQINNNVLNRKKKQHVIIY